MFELEARQLDLGTKRTETKKNKTFNFDVKNNEGALTKAPYLLPVNRSKPKISKS